MEYFSLNLWKRITQYFIGKNNRRPRFPQKAIAAFLAPVKMCLQMRFCFKVPALAIWRSCSSVVTRFLHFTGGLLPTLSSRATSPTESRQTGTWYAEHTVTLCRSLLEDCAAVQLRKPCFWFKPHCHWHLPHSSLWFPGVTGSFSPTCTQPPTLPQPLASGSLAPPESKQCS